MSADISLPFAVFASVTILAFLFGGSARADVLSLVLLRPLAAIGLAAAVVTVRREHFALNKALCWLIGAMGALTVAHLVPLPPALWQHLPGREIVVDGDRIAGLSSVWRPLSMSPDGAWNALFSFLVPIALLISGIQLPRKQLARMVAMMLAIGLLSSLLGLLQVIGGEGSHLYTYRITNAGYLVGLFANRNHQAYFFALLLPLLAVYATRPAPNDDVERRRRIGAAFAAMFLIPILLATGSRGGLIVSGLGLCAAAWLYSGPSASKVVRKGAKTVNLAFPALAMGAVMIVVLLGLVLTRTNGLARLVATGTDEELRMQIWPLILDFSSRYAPFGSGIGSFTEVFQIHEPNSLLMPEYVNHAHNDLIEVWMTLGVPGLALLIATLVFVAVRGFAAIRLSDTNGKLGFVLALMLLLSGLADYPLRTPALQAVMIWAMLLLSSTGKTSSRAV